MKVNAARSMVIELGAPSSAVRRHVSKSEALAKSTVKPLVIDIADSEYGEGEAVEPHREWGFGYLDAIREVFAGDSRLHRDVIPPDLGLSVPAAP